MRNIFLIRSLILMVVALGFIFINPNSTRALKAEDTCSNVEAIFARGSGDKLNQPEMEAARFFSKLRARVIASGLSLGTYELGAEKYNNFQYPAVKINDEKLFHGIAATLSAGDYFVYKNSIAQGAGELQSYLSQRHLKCKPHGTKYILGGMSQGAQVIGSALGGLSSEIRADIVYVGLFGDPKLYYPEGEGVIPAACFGYTSPWRKMIVNSSEGTDCFHNSGWLQARKPYLPDDMKDKTGLWCYRDDFICNPIAFANDAGHKRYREEGKGVDQAAREAIEKLKTRLEKDTPPSPPPHPSDPPRPAPPYRALDTRHIIGEGTTGENVVFAVDVSESMQPEIPSIEQFLRDVIPKIVARGDKFSVAVYWGMSDSSGSTYTIGGGSAFDADPQMVLDRLHDAMQPGSSLFPGSSLYVLDAAFSQLHWSNGATKSVTVFSNNPVVSPDFYTLTVDGIAKRSLEIDPVNIYPVVPESVRESYIDIANKTAGQVITYTNNILEAAYRARTAITERPVALLTTTSYSAEAGSEVNFDASPSYVMNSEITKYEWDFNGDNIFETTTTNPVIKHTYTTDFDGHMQVRLSASNGTIANASAKIHIGHITPPATVAAPQNLTQTITSTTDNKSTVKLSWDPSGSVEHWIIRINDMPIGYLDSSKTSVDITDIERTEDITLSVTSISNSVVTAGTSTVTVAKIAPLPPPITSTCTQSNIFLRIICQAIALYRQFINGIWLYILPYKI